MTTSTTDSPTGLTARSTGEPALPRTERNPADPPERAGIGDSESGFTPLPGRHAEIRRLAGRATVGLVVVAVLGGLIRAAVHVPTPPAVGILFLGWALVVSGLWLLTYHYYWLCPTAYLAWLKQIPPYEPRTLWGQALGEIVGSVRGIGTLILGGFVGAVLATAKSPEELTTASTELFWIMVPIGLVIFVSATLMAKIAIVHQRAFQDGTLPPRPDTGRRPDSFAVAALFFVTWLVLLVLAGLVLHVLGRTTGALPFRDW